MKYKIVEKESFNIIGKEMNASIKMEENFRLIPAFWEECEKTGLCNKLFQLQGKLGILGVCFEIDYGKEKLTYLSAVEKPMEEFGDDYILEEKIIPASTWAIFETRGKMPESIHSLWQRIFAEWFPATGYKYAQKPDLEVYDLKNLSKKDCKAEIWISIE